MTTVIPTERVAIATLTPHPMNARSSDVELLKRSLLRLGQYRTIVANRGTITGRPNEILAGHHITEAARELGWVEMDVGYVDVDDEVATEIMLLDNRTNDVAGYDNRLLLELLETVRDPFHVGYDVGDIDALRHLIESEGYDADRLDEYTEGAKIKPKRRGTHLDMIFSSNSACWTGALIAYSLGWHPGIITSSVTSAVQYTERFPRGKPIMFMDNEWHEYDHAQHLAALARFRPKYGTVRDIVTKDQAAEAGVAYYSIAETLAMAAEVAQHVDNVILIPKFDCLDQLPREVGGKRVVLGYSVESSYGGTDIPPTRFKGWPVHLLGGPWKKQRALLNVLGDDVVSLDNNQMLKVARFAIVNLPDGRNEPLDELLGLALGGERLAGSALNMALALSLGMIMHAVIADFGITPDIDPGDADLIEGTASHEF